MRAKSTEEIKRPNGEIVNDKTRPARLADALADSS
jgi:hypothetical protein